MPSTSGDTKQRTVKACDRCRLKKVKCDGTTPCGRCRSDDAICQFNVRSVGEKRSVSAAHVVQLQAHNEILTKTIRAVWDKYGLPSSENKGDRTWSIHEIVKHSGALEGASLRHFAVDTFDFDNPPSRKSSVLGNGNDSTAGHRGDGDGNKDGHGDEYEEDDYDEGEDGDASMSSSKMGDGQQNNGMECALPGHSRDTMPMDAALDQDQQPFGEHFSDDWVFGNGSFGSHSTSLVPQFPYTDGDSTMALTVPSQQFGSSSGLNRPNRPLQKLRMPTPSFQPFGNGGDNDDHHHYHQLARGQVTGPSGAYSQQTHNQPLVPSDIYYPREQQQQQEQRRYVSANFQSDGQWGHHLLS